MPLWSLLVYFLKCTHIILGQLSPNIIRIIRDKDALNKIHGTNLGLDDVKYCYSFRKGMYGWSLKTRNHAPSLVLPLRDSYKGALKDFNRPPRFAVNTGKINALAHHDGGNALVTQLNHHRAVHILLGYTNTRSSFTKKGNARKTRTLKSGPELSFEEKDTFFSKYKIFNRVHNQWKVYLENKDKKSDHPHMKKSPVEREKGSRRIGRTWTTFLGMSSTWRRRFTSGLPSG
ncbi:hypothetical protein LguiB_012637 [Lonicera macranthoides]